MAHSRLPCPIPHMSSQAIALQSPYPPSPPRRAHSWASPARPLVLSLGHFFDDRESVGENIPAVHHFEAQSDLVIALQITLPVRVTIADDLDWQVALNPPPDAVLEIADDRPDLGIVRLRLARHRVAYRRRDSPEIRNFDPKPKLRVLFTAIVIARIGKGRRVGRAVSAAGNRREVGDQQTDCGLDVDFGVRARVDPQCRCRAVVSPRTDDLASERVDPMIDAQVKGAGERL